jgi:hypothetical protein
MKNILILSALCFIPAAVLAAGNYKNFIASVYARVYEVRQMGNLD